MTYAELLDQFASLRVVVIGDLMLDEYIHGRATRISQEAPVMVVRQDAVTVVPGGAANVAKNLVALGAKTSVIGVIGADEAGERLRGALGDRDVTLVVDPSRPTTRKTRVLADSAHQVVRIDHEATHSIDAETEAELLAAVSERLADADLLLFSDYTKGVLTPTLIGKLIAVAQARQVRTVANAKPTSRLSYRGADLVSLNRPEAAAAAQLSTIHSRAEGVQVAQKLREEMGVRHLLVTLNDDGMATERHEILPVKVEVFDTAGAGDTTIATVALGLAVADDAPEVFALAAETAAAVVRKVGVAIPSPADLDAIRRRV